MKKNALRDRILKNSTIAATAILSESEVFNKRELIPTSVPMINVALSGMVDGGLLAGLLMIAGQSKHFKTGFGLLIASAFLQKYPDGVILFYDSEFGTNDSYFKLFGLNKESFVHCPITNVEEFRTDIAQQFEHIERGDHVMVLVDSIGNLASLKEVEDAQKGSDKEDMTRAKRLASVFRIITPHLTLKNIPMVVVNHTYKEIGLYPKDIVSGGTKSYLSANDIWIVGRQKDQEGEGKDKELQGYNFIIRIEKSRTVKEGSKIPINLSLEDGIYKWSGLWDNALEGGFITSPSKGYYHYEGDVVNEGEPIQKYRRSKFETQNFWTIMLKDKKFLDFIQNKYQLGNVPIIDEPIEEKEEISV